MRRTILGILALVFFIAGVATLAVKGTGESGVSAAASVCMRVGMLLGAFWLALPQVEKLLVRVPLWVLVGVGGGLLLAVTNFRLFHVCAPLLAIAGLAFGAKRFFRWLFEPLPSKSAANRAGASASSTSNAKSSRDSRRSTDGGRANNSGATIDGTCRPSDRDALP